MLLEEMARRMPTLELVGDAQPLRSNFIAGIKHMPVKYPRGQARSLLATSESRVKLGTRTRILGRAPPGEDR